MTQAPPISDHLPLAIRAFTVTKEPEKDDRQRKTTKAKHTRWTLVFDTETDVTTGQALRFGTYQLRDGDELFDSGIFYSPTGITADELECLDRYAKTHDLTLLTRDEFADKVFYQQAYKWRARIVGFNLPFDISRIGKSHGLARGKMRGGFTFEISPHKYHSKLRVKHLSRRAAFIKFTAPWQSPDNRSDRKNKHKNGYRPGHFVDVKTLAGALLAQSFSLASLSKFLRVEHPKLEFDDFDSPVNDHMIEYAVRDTQTTWECYQALTERFAALGLDQTNAEKIYSEAGIGKAYIGAMGITSWQECQPDFDPQVTGNIMATYYGGRSEVRIRREIRQVILCDFLSMYPTVCTLMGLWQFVIADGMEWHDSTDATRQFLDEIDCNSLQRKPTWTRLNTLVRIEPDSDVLPVRAAYGRSSATNIGLNYLSSDKFLWFTLADCIASKLLTGKSLKIIEAVTFVPGNAQSGLEPIDISGNADYRVDPIEHDFFKRMIELRQEIKNKRDMATSVDREALDTEQNAIKIAANATSYGMYAEVNVEENSKSAVTNVFSGTSKSFEFDADKIEKPGSYFHPLLSSLICGAARLMLAITEQLVAEQGLDWSFCDTDSMAIAKPDAMEIDQFQARVASVIKYFETLNPYDFAGSILQIEKANLSLDNPNIPEPLYCLAISAKRYALFNLSAGKQPILRKASAHGLGHFIEPYDETCPSDTMPTPATALSAIGVALWQHDLWISIINASLAGRPDQVDLSYHSALSRPANSRYAATTPALLSWFKTYNQGRDHYLDQVKPFNFMSAFIADKFAGDCAVGTGLSGATRRKPKSVRAVAPYHRDPAIAASMAFDRNSGEPVSVQSLKTYAHALAQYHLQSEAKFLNGKYVDRGTTTRRHVYVTSIRHIGKEAHDWEQQAYLGIDHDAQLDYGMSPEELAAIPARLDHLLTAFNAEYVARALRMSPAKLEKLRSPPKQSARTLATIAPDLLSHLENEARQLDVKKRNDRADLREAVKVEGLRAAARRLGVDPSNLRRRLRD